MKRHGGRRLQRRYRHRPDHTGWAPFPPPQPRGPSGGIPRAIWSSQRNIACNAVTGFGRLRLRPSATSNSTNAVALQLVRGNDGPDLIIGREQLANTRCIWKEPSGNPAHHRREDGRQRVHQLKCFGVGRSLTLRSTAAFGATAATPIRPRAGPRQHLSMYFLNTTHLHRPHRDRNMVPLDPDRFSVNRMPWSEAIGWAGNMTVSNSRLQAC